MTIRATTGLSVIALAFGVSDAAIVTATSPLDLDFIMGTPLLPVPDDGSPIGTVYGGGIDGLASPLATPIGPMGFLPEHEKIGLGMYKAIPAPGPIAGSDIVPPAGCTAIDFFIVNDPGALFSFEITAVGTLTSAVFVVPAPIGPSYVGFGAFGEEIIDISIVALPFPSPTTLTWIVSDIRVVPAPGVGVLVGVAGLMLAGTRRRA